MSRILKNYLTEYDYEIIALPKKKINPLDLLIQRSRNDLQEYDASLLDLFQKDIHGLPLVKKNAANINGGKLLEADASLGASLLSNLFKFLQWGDNKLDANLSFQKDILVSFSFEDIIEYKVKRQALDDFLVTAIPVKDGFIRSKERLYKGELFIITSLLKSNSVLVEFSSVKGTEAKLNAGIQSLAKVNSNIKVLKENELSISFDHDKPITFAYRAARVIYDKKRWFEFWQKDTRFSIKDQKGYTLKGVEDFPIDPLNTDDGISYF